MRRLAVTIFVLAATGCSSFAPVGSQQASRTASPSWPSPPSNVTAEAQSPPATLGPSLPFPLCGDVHAVEAPAAWYRDIAPVGPGTNPDVTDVTAWASHQPGFEELWIDRDRRSGWISVGFSRNSEDRQAEVVAMFPDRPVVVVPVPHTTDELNKLATRIAGVLTAAGLRSFAVNAYVYQGIVHADVNFLVPAWLHALAEHFTGEPLCVDGRDPALMPREGPQPTGGDGWQLLADQDETGDSYHTGIAYDDASYAKLWQHVGLRGERPSVDFGRSVVIWFGAVHGSSCPRLRLDGVVVDHERALVHAKITELDYGVCTADAVPHAYVVALERDRLPHRAFAIQLGAEDPPPGAPDERTVVDVDLSAPGSTAKPSQIHGGGSTP